MPFLRRDREGALANVSIKTPGIFSCLQTTRQQALIVKRGCLDPPSERTSLVGSGAPMLRKAAESVP